MKRILILTLVLLLPIMAIAQEEASTQNFLQELVNVLNTDSSKANEKVKEEAAKKLDSALSPIVDKLEDEAGKAIKSGAKKAANILPAPSMPALSKPAVSPKTTSSKLAVPALPKTADSKAKAASKSVAQDLSAPVLSPNISIGSKSGSDSKAKKGLFNRKKKGKEEEIDPLADSQEKNGEEDRLFKPYIIPAENPKNKTQRNYLKTMNKMPDRRQRLVTFDNSDIIFGRHYRSVLHGIENPSNLGVRTEKMNSFSILPINTIDLDVKSSTPPLELLENYFSGGGQTLDSNFVNDLGDGGFSLPISVSLPTILNIKLSGVFGTLSLNSGLFVSEDFLLPASFFGIIFEGATFDDPYEMTSDLGLNAAAYLKNTVGYGSFIDLPRPFGELRFGGNVNVYAGAFASAELTQLELTPTTEGTTVQATATVSTLADSLNLIDENGFHYGLPTDYMSIPQFTYGFDAGLAWRFKLNRILPIMPNILKNYIDVQVGVQDIGASLQMNHGITKEITFEAEVGDVLSLFMGDSLDVNELMEIDERVVSQDTTLTRPIASKLTFGFTYQPLDMIMVTANFKQTLSDGIGASEALEYKYGLYVYPTPSFGVYAGLQKEQQYESWDVGLMANSMKSEISLIVKVYNTPFDLDSGLSGAGLRLNWARYF